MHMPGPARYPQTQFEAPPGATALVLVRHGESEAAVEGESFDLVDGQGDPSLAAEGRIQAESVCRRLSGEHIDAIYTSHLRRTIQTAQPLVDRLDLAPTVDRDLREVFLGEWEGGLFRQKVAGRDATAVRMFEEQTWEVIPGAEPADEFGARVRSVVRRIAADHPDQTVAVFTHGATIGELLAQATGARPFAFVGSDNAAISRVVITAEQWIVRSFNDCSHLETG